MWSSQCPSDKTLIICWLKRERRHHNSWIPSVESYKMYQNVDQGVLGTNTIEIENYRSTWVCYSTGGFGRDMFGKLWGPCPQNRCLMSSLFACSHFEGFQIIPGASHVRCREMVSISGRKSLNLKALRNGSQPSSLVLGKAWKGQPESKPVGMQLHYLDVFGMSKPQTSQDKLSVHKHG